LVHANASMAMVNRPRHVFDELLAMNLAGYRQGVML
jgi:hypothetical protein